MAVIRVVRSVRALPLLLLTSTLSMSLLSRLVAQGDVPDLKLGDKVEIDARWGYGLRTTAADGSDLLEVLPGGCRDFAWLSAESLAVPCRGAICRVSFGDGAAVVIGGGLGRSQGHMLRRGSDGSSLSFWCIPFEGQDSSPSGSTSALRHTPEQTRFGPDLWGWTCFRLDPVTGSMDVAYTEPLTAALITKPPWGNGRESPDGKRLIYAGTGHRLRVRTAPRPDVQSDLWVSRPQGAEARRITRTRDLYEADPSWSPDGEWIVFAGDPEPDCPESRSDIHVVRADGSERRQLTDSAELRDTEPVWSPDGEWIAFTRARRGDWLHGPDIMRIRPDGTGLAPLTESDDAEFSPQWSPSGHRLAFLVQARATPSGQGYGPQLAYRRRWVAAAGMDINAPLNSDGATKGTRLHGAAKSGSWEVAEALLQSGADVAARDAQGRTPLHVAPNGTMARLLVKWGAGVSATDDLGRMPLHYGAREEGIIDALLAAGAEVDVRDSAGQTPLCFVDDPLGVRALVAAGADVVARDGMEQTPLHIVAVNANWWQGVFGIYDGAMLALLDAGAELEARDGLGRTPLLAAAAEHGAVGALLWAGAELEFRDRLGRTPLLAAAAAERGRVWPLLQAGADSSATDGEGATALELAAASGNSLAEIGLRRIAARPDGMPGGPSRGGPDVEERPAASVEELLEALESEDYGVWITAVRDLGRLGPAAEEAVPRLIELLDGGTTGSVYAAGRALCRIGDSRALLALVEALGDGIHWTGPGNEEWALEAFGNKPAGVEEELQALVEDRSASEYGRCVALRLLRQSARD